MIVSTSESRANDAAFARVAALSGNDWTQWDDADFANYVHHYNFVMNEHRAFFAEEMANVKSNKGKR